MKKIIVLSFVLAFAVSSVSFAQYGGGIIGGTYMGSQGGNGPVLTMDNCPNGDLSANFYDGSCGTPVNPNQVSSDPLLTTGPGDSIITKIKKKIKKRRISFTNYLKTLPVLNIFGN